MYFFEGKKKKRTETKASKNIRAEREIAVPILRSVSNYAVPILGLYRIPMISKQTSIAPVVIADVNLRTNYNFCHYLKQAN